MLGHFSWEIFFGLDKISMYWSHLKTRKAGQVKKNNNYLSNVVGGPSGEHLCVRSCSVRKLVHSQSPTVLDTERSPVQEVQDYWETFFLQRY